MLDEVSPNQMRDGERETLLSIEHLHIQSPAGDPLVADVSIGCAHGEFTVIVGESGSGKSLTIASILGLNPQNLLTHGSLRFEHLSFDLSKERELAPLRGLRVGMIFQDAAASLNPVRTIGSQLSETIRVLVPGCSADVARERSLRLLEQVNIDNPSKRYGQYAHELSGGMNQRVMIALALCGSPSLLIADEPTTALDAKTQLQILELFRDLQREIGLTVLMVTHDFRIVRGYADYVYVMHQGRIVAQAEPANLNLIRKQHQHLDDLLAAAELEEIE